MTKTIFIASAEPYSGKSVVALGLVDMLLGKAQKIGYFKPIINYDPVEQKDIHIQTIIEHFQLLLKYEDVYAFTRHQALQHLEAGTQGEAIDIIIGKFKKLEENYDFTVLEGSDFVGQGAAFEFETNMLIAKNLNAPALLVISGDKKTTAQIIQECLNFLRAYQAREIQVLSIIVNKVKPEQAEDIKALLAAQLPDDIIPAVIPSNIAVAKPKR